MSSAHIPLVQAGISQSQLDLLAATLARPQSPSQRKTDLPAEVSAIPPPLLKCYIFLYLYKGQVRTPISHGVLNRTTSRSDHVLTTPSLAASPSPPPQFIKTGL